MRNRQKGGYMEIPLYVIYLAIAAAVALLLCIFFDFDPRNVRYKGVWFRRRLLRAAVDRAKKIGPLLASNVVDHIVGLTTVADSAHGLELFKQMAERGELPSWQRKLIFAKPTFTFYRKPEEATFLNTGNYDDCDNLIKKVIRLATGLDPDLFEEEELRQVSYQLIRSDPRLFVPYVGSKIKPQEWQFSRYGQTDLSQAEAYLLDYVKRQIARRN